MLYGAKNGNIKIGNTDMDYITFGSGTRNVILIPGLGDGLRTVKGKALPFAFMYRSFAKDYKVYMFSRKNTLEEGYTTRDMARDQKIAMDKLGIKKADIVGVSQGGMIAQYIAIDYPEVVNKLVLTVTLSKQNEVIQSVVRTWIQWAREGKYEEINLDTAEKMYSETYLKKYGRLYSFFIRIGKPKEFSRFLIMADACLSHNAYSELEKIKVPCFVIGANEDLIVTGAASEEIAEKITGSELYMYDGYGHGVFEEAEDFNKCVQDFLDK